MSLLGRQIGRYKILEELGSGGMSVVYKGLDTALDREVAVKVLHPHLASKPESRRRLAREAKAVAKLHHPNILEVFDFAGADTSEAYIVTEYIRGKTLREALAHHKPYPPEIAALVIAELSAALAQAHEAGIIHRDLKPENVMVREDGVLKLMDFGIAKIVDRDDRMTMTGALVGSPAHMAPEIIEGEESGPECDVFSLGTMLYLLATDRLPFSGANTTATLKKILDGTYDDPRQLVPALSDDLAEIIATCLAREPLQRYPTAGGLNEALTGYLSGLGINHVSEELHAFFADPPSYRKDLLRRLPEVLIKRSEEFLAQKRPAKALAGLNQVLALDEKHARANQLLQQMNVTRRRRRKLTLSVRFALGGLTAVGLASAAWVLYDVATRPKDFVPVGTRPSEVVVPASAFPPPPARTAPVPPSSGQGTLPAEIKRPPPRPVLGSVARPTDPKLGAFPAGGDVEIQVKPHGYVQVDDGPRSADSLRSHRIRLAAGSHRVRVSCDWCEDAVETIHVKGDGTDAFFFATRPKPAHLGFDFEPPDALIRVGSVERTARQTLTDPITVSLPRGVPKQVIDYEVSLPGFITQRKSIEVAAGKNEVLSGRLARP